MEPVVSETQLKSFGPNFIKFAASETVKPPRISPFVTADTNTASPTQTHGITTSERDQQPSSSTSSSQTRRLTAPESLRNTHTPPTTLSAHSYHTSSSQSHRLAAAESLKLPHSSPPTSAYNPQVSPSHISSTGPHESFEAPHKVSVDSHTQSSVRPLIQHKQPIHEREIVNEVVAHHSLPRSSALATGDGWVDALSGTGSQVSIGSHSPKPQSVSHFAIDVEDGVGTSQSQSQTSEVDCTYIGPSNVESVFVTSGYMYIKPSSDFSPNKKNGSKDQTFKEKQSPNNEKLTQEANNSEVCETVSSVTANTVVHDMSPSAESTLVSQGNLHLATNEGSMLQSIKPSPGGITCATTTSEQLNKMPSVAERRLAFEKQAQIKESDTKVASKPDKKPPAIPKRVSSISNVEKQQESAQNGNNDVTNSVKDPSCSLRIENTITEEEDIPPTPPPPPMSTHPGLLVKSGSDEQLEVQDDSRTTKSAVELPQEVDAYKPKPKERKVSVPVAKPEPDQNSRSLTLNDDACSPVPEVTKPIAEAEGIPVSVLPGEDKGLNSVHEPVPPSQREASLNGGKTNGDNIEADDEKQAVNAEMFKEETDYLCDEQSPSTRSFGHVSPSGTSALLDTTVISEEPTNLNVERSGLDSIDPSKNMGAEVSTFKPVPKPRSYQRHSMYVGDIRTTVTDNVFSGDSISPACQPTNNTPTAAASLLRPPTQPHSYTPDMKRSSMHFPTPENKRKMILRAQSMSMTTTTLTGSASPRMVVRGEQRSQMPPGFIMYSRSQEAVVGRHPTMPSSTMLQSIQASTGKKGDGDKKGAAAAPMNTKRALKKRRSFLKRK